MTIRDILSTGNSAADGLAKLRDRGPGTVAYDCEHGRILASPVAAVVPQVTDTRLPPGAVAEYRFHARRRWRFDFAWVERLVALEVEGGAWTRGRHTRGAGYVADLEKYSEAAIAGWCVVRCTPDELENGVAMDGVTRALAARASE